MRKTGVKWLVAIVMFLSIGIMSKATYTFAESNEFQVENTKELLVKYADDYRTLSEPLIERKVVSMESIADQVELLTFPENTDMEAVKIELENNPSVAYVEPNYERHLFTAANDPYYNNQWWVPHVKAEGMWTQAGAQQGKVVVAVIDSGIDLKHEDLSERIESGGYNFYAGNTDIMDVNGHGTMVSGVISARSGNGKGISGIVGPYDISILPLKISHYSNTSKVSDEIKAIDYAIAKKVSVINISLGGAGHSTFENDAIQRANRAGIVVVAAAGNGALEGNAVSYPASYDHVLSVGAINKYNVRSNFSNYNAYVDLVAPGEMITTTLLNQSYGQVNGTSFSSPIVAGTVAMMKALKPEVTNSEVTNLLTSTAKDLGTPGRDNHYGAGVLDLEKLMTHIGLEDKKAVTGVKLNTTELYMDMRISHQHFGIADENIVVLEDMRENAALMFEREPNNNYSAANSMLAGNSVVGSITDFYFDLDYYQFNFDTAGTLSLLAGWVESTYVNHFDNRYLEIGLYNEQQQLIDYASLEKMSNGEGSKYLSEKLKRGTYYLVVFQSSPYKHLFTDERYMVTTLFTPDATPETPPKKLFNEAFMKVGEKKPYVSGFHSKSVFASSNPSVATIDNKGVVSAVGHGTTVVSHIIGTDVQRSVVKVSTDLSNETTALFEEVLPNGAADKSVLWKSSDDAVAAVDKFGIITAKGNGQAQITVVTNDGGYQASATVTVEGAAVSEFVGDFPEMIVADSKVFTVTFNQELDAKKDYRKDIMISRKADGKQQLTSFTAKVDPASRKKLLITPTTKWAKGEHYLTISKDMQSNGQQSLKENVRMKFVADVGEDFKVIETNKGELQEYNKLLTEVE